MVPERRRLRDLINAHGKVVEKFRLDFLQTLLDRGLNEDYLAGGQHLWNSGMFLFRADRLVEELGRFEPKLIEAVREALASKLEFSVVRQVASHISRRVGYAFSPYHVNLGEGAHLTGLGLGQLLIPQRWAAALSSGATARMTARVSRPAWRMRSATRSASLACSAAGAWRDSA
ncbi:nucleotidyltransferase-like protein [Nitrospirillum amazonense]|uniref:Nucleotidyltransferase-like protein n=1 Tax=Nitrospirillum amazonense TaxID=28077 RepID=A0A560ESN1_9PROT|nr:nucleotidyltransferase-like protein [Nitrospirillum amazonense]